MEKYFSSGGAGNPDFNYKVNVTTVTTPMIEWCDAYPVEGSGYFQRYYIKWKPVAMGAEFQFEVAEAAVLFKLRFGSS